MVTGDLGACEWFVWDLRRSGLIDRGQLDTIVGEFLRKNPRAEAPALAEYLVSQGTLTNFQAERVLNSKSAGLVLGPYVLLDAIGSGSMGQVYKASSKNDSNLYAVKVLPRRSMWNVRLARRQVRSFANFTHPAVVPFVDVGTAGGLHYLVWPLVEGSTLEALVQHNGKLPANQAALYALQIAQGLTDAHQNGLFHGLLKPSNVMIGSDNQARILDFGIGSLLVENEGESLVDTMSTANTLTSGLDCASPESIMEPTNRTPAGDQYSLGCVLYSCLTGRVPFPEGSAVEKMMAHQTKDPMPIQELSPDVPDELVEIVKKLMAKTPEERFSGCDELVEALEPFVGDPRNIPGGMPGAPAASGGRGSSGGLPALGARPAPGPGRGSPSGSAPKLPGLPAKSPPPAARVPAPPPPPPGRIPPAKAASRPAIHLPPEQPAEDEDGFNPGAMPTKAPAMEPLPSSPRGGPPKVPGRPAQGRPKPPPPPPEPEEEAMAEEEYAEDDNPRQALGLNRKAMRGGGGEGGGPNQVVLVLLVVVLMVGAFLVAKMFM